MAITALPTPPRRDHPASFSDDGDAFLGALPAFVTEANALATDVNDAADTAIAQADAALSAVGAVMWVSGTTYSVGNCVWSPITHYSYRRKIAGAGTTDPSSDATNWQVLNTGISLDGADTLTNKTISGASNTLTADGSNAVGFREIPQNSQSTAYTCVLEDSGKHILHPSADTAARTFTIPANASVAYPVGTAITFVNQASAGVMTIAITTDTMRLAGAGTTGSRTLAANGVATAIKLTSTEWIISGNLT